MEENSALQEDFETQRQALESALAIGNELLKSCSEEDRPMLAEKLNNVKERYDKLNAKVGTFACVCAYVCVCVELSCLVGLS